ncbi:MAG: hypothetical protein COT91_05350 [Candidatus Doudnabacteria bacterium CG10_big_fil_rev_8_21_14_0_10_41_10]|uniref:DNA replication and repair protein RecF n=1 Tax=Candidatus Doudnabacteria bacterium CG10_big_fil_rev_8_21_14_0_10_41_10 TaxID=1974551 RepID=A0A2H0VE93_9BACT|nr:MAG: hypothetical protein COT91_05350 [Candidatus Doudnabacteria bacterium CG10_big_fil_rev_8_21_14_0_10_41_10]
MKISRLRLENFRGLSNLDLKIDQDFVILVGKNASGKTSFLESIFYASVLLGLPPNKSWELIGFGKNYFRIKVETKEKEFEYYYGRKNEKRYERAQKIDGVRKKAGEMLGYLPVVVFLPQDLNLLQLSPSLRREYLDDILLQTNKDYEEELSSYTKVVSQRNELLYNIRQGSAGLDQLDFWDTKTIELAEKIVRKRKEFSDYVDQGLSLLYKKVSGQERDLRFYYNNSLGENPGMYAKKFLEKRQADIASGRTGAGPHRDDWKIQDSNSFNLAHFLSRGEQRSIVTCLKRKEVAYLQDGLHMSPIVLLDEIQAELDEDRRRQVLESLPEDSQIFLTTTNLEELPEEIVKNALVIEL